MKSAAKAISMRSYEDLFSTDEERADAKKEKVTDIPLSELHSFKNHPFKVIDNDEMQDLAESIRQYGVLVPALARPDPDGGYELIAGHRRKYASELAGLETMPVIVREMDDDTATIAMVDSNQQREELLPSERAFSYKLKLEAMKHQGERMDLTCSQVGNKSSGKKSSELLAEQVGQSKNQIFRYIRLTELLPELLNKVDEKKIAFNPAYELSFLSHEEQAVILEALNGEGGSISLAQAEQLKKLSQDGQFTRDAALTILCGKKPASVKFSLKEKKVRKYFPTDYTPQQMEDVILELLEKWSVENNPQ